MEACLESDIRDETERSIMQQTTTTLRTTTAKSNIMHSHDDE